MRLIISFLGLLLLLVLVADFQMVRAEGRSMEEMELPREVPDAALPTLPPTNEPFIQQPLEIQEVDTSIDDQPPAASPGEPKP